MDWSQFGFNNDFLKNIMSYNKQDQNILFNALKENPSLAGKLQNGQYDINGIITDWSTARQGDTFNKWFGTGSDGNEYFMGMKGSENLKTGQTEYGGATPFQWGAAALGAASTLYGMYQGNKQLKLAKANFEEQKALQRANYENQAKAYNNSLRNQQSGRSFSGMSGEAKRTLGREYNSRKVREQYA